MGPALFDSRLGGHCPFQYHQNHCFIYFDFCLFYLWVGNSVCITPSWSEVEVKVTTLTLEPETSFHRTSLLWNQLGSDMMGPQEGILLIGSSPDAPSFRNPSFILTSALPHVACSFLLVLCNSADISRACAGKEMNKAEPAPWRSSPDLFFSIEWKCFKLRWWLWLGKATQTDN